MLISRRYSNFLSLNIKRRPSRPLPCLATWRGHRETRRRRLSSTCLRRGVQHVPRAPPDLEVSLRIPRDNTVNRADRSTSLFCRAFLRPCENMHAQRDDICHTLATCAPNSVLFSITRRYRTMRTMADSNSAPV